MVTNWSVDERVTLYKYTAMQSFITFITEAKNNDDRMWRQIDSHDRALSGRHKEYVDDWVGASHSELDSYRRGGVAPLGLMTPGPLEKNYSEVHGLGAPIRKALSDVYGDTVRAYRGVVDNGKQSTGRLNVLSSWTTDRKVAHAFAGALQRKTYKVYSDKEIEKYERRLNDTGKVRVRPHTFVKNDSGYIDIYDRHGNHVTDTESLRDHFGSINKYSKEHNAEVNDSKKIAARRVITRQIPVDDVVWATNRMGQRELIVRAPKTE